MYEYRCKFCRKLHTFSEESKSDFLKCECGEMFSFDAEAKEIIFYCPNEWIKLEKRKNKIKHLIFNCVCEKTNTIRRDFADDGFECECGRFYTLGKREGGYLFKCGDIEIAPLIKNMEALC